MVTREQRRDPTELERERERMMEERADDLPFRIRQNSNVRWGLIALIVLLGLSMPLLYVGVGVLSGAGATQAGMIAIFVLIAALMAAVVYAVFAFSRRSSRHLRATRERFEQNMSRRRGNMLDREKRVREIMVSHPVECGYLDSLQEAAVLMYQNNVGWIPIVDAQEKCIGVLTDRDIVCGGLAQDMDPKTTPVTTIMERNFKSTRPDYTLAEALEFMRNEAVRRLPVIDDGKCVGVLSIDDLISRRLVDMDEIAPIFQHQLSEPNPRHGLGGGQAA